MLDIHVPEHLYSTIKVASKGAKTLLSIQSVDLECP